MSTSSRMRGCAVNPTRDRQGLHDEPDAGAGAHFLRAALAPPVDHLHRFIGVAPHLPVPFLPPQPQRMALRGSMESLACADAALLSNCRAANDVCRGEDGNSRPWRLRQDARHEHMRIELTFSRGCSHTAAGSTCPTTSQLPIFSQTAARSSSVSAKGK